MMMLKPVQTEPTTDRMPDASAGMATGRTPSDVRGVIDNATSDRLYGWAWDANQPGHRVKVELRLAGDVVANTVADFVRPDLAKNGVGDGCHAFEFPLLPDWFDRRSELTAVAFGADGREFPIAVRIRRPDDAQVGTHLQRALEGVIADQLDLRREVGALRDRAAQLPEASAVDAIAKAGEEMQRRVDQLELWLTRLDARLAEAAQPATAAAHRGVDPWVVVVIAVLASCTVGALAAAAAIFWF
jgi:hypothetical protein